MGINPLICFVRLLLGSGCGTYRYSIELLKVEAPLPVSASSFFLREGRVLKPLQYRVVRHFSFEKRVSWPLRKKPKVLPLEISHELDELGTRLRADGIVNLKIIPFQNDNKSERKAVSLKSFGNS